MNERDAALQHVNQVRARLGYEPVPYLLPGIQHAASCCPLANSIRAGHEDDVRVTTYQNTHVTNLHTGESVVSMRNPPKVHSFAVQFDEGKYRDLRRWG